MFKDLLSKLQKKQTLEEVKHFEKDVTEQKISEAEGYAQKHSKNKRLSQIWDTIQLVFEIAKHPDVWGKSVSIAAGAVLIYLLSPIDVIPDFNPGLGFADDCFAILMVVKQVTDAIQKKVQANPQFLNLIPEKLRPVAVKCFNIAASTSSNGSGNVADANFHIVKDAGKTVSGKIITGLYGGAGKLYGKMAEKCRLDEENGKTNSLIYKIRKKILEGSENGVYVVAKNLPMVQAAQESLDQEANRTLTKTLLSFFLFACGIASFKLTESSIVFAYLSAIMFALSYSFWIIAICKGIYLFFVFIVQGIKMHKQHKDFSFFDCGVCAVATGMYHLDPHTSIQIFHSTLQNKDLSKSIVRICYRLFNSALIRLIINMVLISGGLAILKVVAGSLHYQATGFELLILPFKAIFKG